MRGLDINTGNQVDQWDCSISFLPMLMIETAAQARSGAVATESFRNEMVAANQTRLQHLSRLALPKE